MRTWGGVGGSTSPRSRLNFDDKESDRKQDSNAVLLLQGIQP